MNYILRDKAFKSRSEIKNLYIYQELSMIFPNWAKLINFDKSAEIQPGFQSFAQ